MKHDRLQSNTKAELDYLNSSKSVVVANIAIISLRPKRKSVKSVTGYIEQGLLLNFIVALSSSRVQARLRE